MAHRIGAWDESQRLRSLRPAGAHARGSGRPRLKSRRAPRVTLSLAIALVTGAAGCGKKPARQAQAAPTHGVVGRVLSVSGKVTWSAREDGPETPFKPGDLVRAEWTVRTGPDAAFRVRLRNGHLWQLGANVVKRVSSARGLTLPPVRDTALGQLADLGSGSGKDRTSAAGRAQEHSVGSPAAPTHPSQLAVAMGPPEKPSDGEADDRASMAPIQDHAVRSHPRQTVRRGTRHGVGGGRRGGGGGRIGSVGDLGLGGGGRVVTRGRAIAIRPAKTPRSGETRSLKALPERAAPRSPAPPPTAGRPVGGGGSASPRGNKGSSSRDAARAAAAARKILASRRARIAQCLGKAGLRGKVTLWVSVVGRSGRIVKVLDSQRTLPPVARTCILRAVHRLHLPQHATPYQVSFTVIGR